MAVVDDQGAPVPDVKVSAKETWESWKGDIDESEEPYFHSQWNNEIPWMEGVTNAEGKTVITVEITSLDGTKGAQPPASRDVISNSEYIIKLQGRNNGDEVHMRMQPGAVGTGKHFTLRIEKIEEPRYVQTK